MARIIVIDDDPVTLAAADALLARLGHEVAVARGGVEGIAHFIAKETHLVITDIFMPGQDGLETLRRLKSLDPGVKVACMSGGPSSNPVAGVRDTMLRFARECGADAVLAKPLTAEGLAGLLESMLAARPAGPGVAA